MSTDKFTQDEVSDFLSAYVECAFWSSVVSNEEGDDLGPLDSVKSESDLSETSAWEMMGECVDFLTCERRLIREAMTHEGYNVSQAGHDFWLTRNHHGAGFWDRGLGDVGDKLTKEAHAYGSSDLYVGDDGKVYVS